MRDYLTLGPVPSDEQCEQVGPDCDYAKMQRECNAYKAQLQRLFPAAHFIVKSFPHDFGNYREVLVTYDPSNQKELTLAYHIESHCPTNWDTEALKQLEENSGLTRAATYRSSGSGA